MVLHYRETDPVSGRWTANTSGVKLSSFQGDENIFTLNAAIAAVAATVTPSRSIASITQSGDQLTFHMSDATTEGPFTIPGLTLLSRGAWAPSTLYSLNNTFFINGTVYLVIFPHTSALTFDTGANDGMGHDFYSEFVPNPGNALATGGAVGAVYTKTTTADFAANWQFVNAVHVTFSPSTASGLTSTDVASALEELEVLIHDEVDNAHDVVFTPSTGSTLTATNVADALEELDASITSPDLSGVLHLSGGTMTGALTLSADPASSFQAATKQYVDGIALNLGKRQTVRAATTANIVIASGLNSGDVIDGVTLATNNLVLVKDQSTPAQNGIYVVDVSPVRFVEFDTYDEHPGSLIAVQEGGQAASIWLCTSNVGGTLGTTPIVFSPSSTSGALLAANNLSDVPNKATARANLVIKEALSLLTDVNVTEGAGIDGYALKWNNATGKWIAAVSTGGTTYTNGAGLDLTGTTFSLSANAEIDVIEFVIDGGGSVITTGVKGYIEVPFACTITRSTLLADQSGSIVVDVFKCTYAQFDAGSAHPVSGDKITASAPPTISSTTKAQDSTLTGWTTAISAGDILAFNVNSVTTVQRATISLKVTHA